MRVAPSGLLAEELGVGGSEVHLLECEGEALLKLEASKVRYALSRSKVDNCPVLVIPYKCSLPDGQVRVYDHFAVYWHNDAAYAAKLWNWWNGWK